MPSASNALASASVHHRIKATISLISSCVRGLSAAVSVVDKAPLKQASCSSTEFAALGLSLCGRGASMVHEACNQLAECSLQVSCLLCDISAAAAM